MNYLDKAQLLAEPLRLPAGDGQHASVHVFEASAILAVNAALACNRPLLVRGEPGTGKSQLARAVAYALKRPYLSKFVDARTEATDLLWHHDAVTRLAEAQVHGANETPDAVRDRVERAHYVTPGPLWWALNWQRAKQHIEKPGLRIKAAEPHYDQPRCSPDHGVVLLIDEIDKADSSVPNGLLECLGNRIFTVPGIDEVIRATVMPPLVILTTNEDRVLPDAFIRRCVVLHLRVPDPDIWDEHEGERLSAGSLETWLVERGLAHFGERGLTRDVALVAAKQVVKDRRRVREDGHCPAGLAEYIDLLAALYGDAESFDGAESRVEALAPYFLHKHADPTPRRKTGRGA
jgi:MoxR-like ATPase